jgi:RNA polymerase sigma factor (sigma-70 family)
MYRRHVTADKRSVLREERQPQLNDESKHELASRLVAVSLPPSGRLMLAEMLARVHQALQQLKAGDREMLVLRHLEQLSVEEIADVLGISRANVATRHLRALERLRDVLGEK